MTSTLARIDWTGAMAGAERGDRAVAASLQSLAALFAGSFDEGLQFIRQARLAEPLNPLHDMRAALLHGRFGDHAGATAILQRLQRHELSAPILLYLRALFALRSGRADQARSIIGTLETAHPDFLLAKFLRAEAQLVIAANASKLERYLRGLPTDARWEHSWADLLIKLTLLHPKDGPALAARYEKRVGAAGALRGAFDKIAGWAGASVEELTEKLEPEQPNSRSEALLLECLAERLARTEESASLEQSVRALSAIVARHPDRKAVRQIVQGFQARLAAAAAADKQYEEALRFTERSLTALPYDLTYYQNRATLFTLLRELDAYHEAWETLNRQQYRLLLLGLAEPVLGQIIKTHRVFAQQALGGTERLSRGLFQLVPRDDAAPVQRLNEEAIAADPDLLRQWFHHKRAELVCRHLAIGGPASQMLLFPVDRDEAVARAEALDALGTSLAVLVPEEGALLADVLRQRWSAAADTVQTSYGTVTKKEGGTETDEPNDAVPLTDPDNDALRELQEEHLAVFADLHLLCRTWSPQYEHIWIAEEILAWLPGQLALVNIETLAAGEKDSARTMPFALRHLASWLREDGTERAISEQSNDDLRIVLEGAAANLLRNIAYAAYNGMPGDTTDRAAQALEYVTRARSLRPADAGIEFAAARFLLLGDYYDESRKVLERCRRLIDTDDEWLSERVDELDTMLAEHRRKGESGSTYKQQAGAEISDAGDVLKINDLLAEIDQAPASWRLYAALMKELVLAGRAAEAVEWADRCVARCLAKSEQVSARGLAMEARGLRTLAAENPRAAKLYAASTYEPARRAIEGLDPQKTSFDVSLFYLLGRCQLETGMPDAASASFRAAFDMSDRSIYRPVLQRLTQDIDQAYLTVARAMIESKIKDGDFSEAVAESCRVMARLKRPENWLVDMARMFCSIAMTRLRGDKTATPISRFDLAVSWRDRFDQALAADDNAERAIAVANLAMEIDPDGAPRAQLVVDRAMTLRQQYIVADALDRAGQLLSARNFDQTLALIDGLDDAIRDAPRVRRLRILALLGAHRFQEADDAVSAFGDVHSPDIRDFLAGYPTLAFRQRIALAQKMLREGNAQQALAALTDLTATGLKEEADLAYCRAFAAALDGFDLQKRGDKKAAQRSFEHGMTLLEPFVRLPTATPHIAELYERLDKELDQYAL